MENTNYLTQEQIAALKPGDRVKHWAGDTGVVECVRQETLFYTETADGEFPVRKWQAYVKPDRRPRQRKDYQVAAWDGLVQLEAK